MLLSLQMEYVQKEAKPMLRAYDKNLFCRSLLHFPALSFLQCFSYNKGGLILLKAESPLGGKMSRFEK